MAVLSVDRLRLRVGRSPGEYERLSYVCQMGDRIAYLQFRNDCGRLASDHSCNCFRVSLVFRSEKGANVRRRPHCGRNLD